MIKGFLESIKDVTFEELFTSKEKAVEMYLRLERTYMQAESGRKIAIQALAEHGLIDGCGGIVPKR